MITRLQSAAPSDDSAVVARRLSRRWKLLQVLGAALIALAGLTDRWHLSDPTVPVTPWFFVTLGLIVFISGFVRQRVCSAGHAAD
jgi:polyferredoxin